VHNPEINWKTKKVKITRYLLLYRRNTVVKENIEQRKKMGKRIKNIDKENRDKWKWTMEEKFNEEIKLDKEKVKGIVP